MRIKVLTLNIWGTPTAKDRAARVTAIAQQLMERDDDLVGLQECWLAQDRARLFTLLSRSHLKHTHYFRSAYLGSGLVILSRWPMMRARFYRYTLNGRPDDIAHGDYFGAKGIGWVQVQTPDGPLNVCNTHPIAQYVERDSEDKNAVHRAAQFYEALAFLDENVDPAAPLVCLGDFNMQPHQVGYRALTRLAHLRDAWAEAHPAAAGYTYRPENPYTSSSQPQRLDYLLLRDGVSQRLTVKTAALTFTPADYAAEQRGGGASAYSDHDGLAVALDMALASPADADDDTTRTLQRAVLHELGAMFASGAAEAREQRLLAVLDLLRSLFTLLIVLRAVRRHRGARRALDLLALPVTLLPLIFYLWRPHR